MAGGVEVARKVVSLIPIQFRTEQGYSIEQFREMEMMFDTIRRRQDFLGDAFERLAHRGKRRRRRRPIGYHPDPLPGRIDEEIELAAGRNRPHGA